MGTQQEPGGIRRERPVRSPQMTAHTSKEHPATNCHRYRWINLYVTIDLHYNKEILLPFNLKLFNRTRGK